MTARDAADRGGHVIDQTSWIKANWDPTTTMRKGSDGSP